MSYHVIGAAAPNVSIREIVPIDPTTSAFPRMLSHSGDDFLDFTDNTTSHRTDEDDDETSGPGYGLAEGVLIGLVLSSFIVLALAGNALVMVAILTDRHLRRTSNYFIVSLAVADAMVALVVMTFSTANDVAGRWMFGRELCNVWMSSDVMCSTASIMNLCAISLDRYIHIRNPLHYETWVTHRRTLAAIFGVWILSALISFLPIQLGWHRARAAADADDDDVITDNYVITDGDDAIVVCSLDLNPLYAILSSTISFYLPCVVMILIYAKLYHYARVHVKRIRRDEELASKITSSSSDTVADAVRSRMTEHKAAVTLGVIMGVFLVCWAPFFTANVVGAVCSSCVPSGVFSVFTWLGYVNSTMNPIIYSIFNQEFSSAFRRVLAGVHLCGLPPPAGREALDQPPPPPPSTSAIEMNGRSYGSTRPADHQRTGAKCPVVSL